MEYEDLIRVLMENKDVPFVRRINDRYVHPVLDNQDGTISTHSMADSESDGRHYAYPTVVSDNNHGLKRLADSMAFENAMNSGNYIEFPNAQDANWFARNYKQAWDK